MGDALGRKRRQGLSAKSVVWHCQACGFSPSASPVCCPSLQVPTKTSGKSYQINGVITQIDDTTLEISELPIRKWTQVQL